MTAAEFLFILTATELLAEAKADSTLTASDKGTTEVISGQVLSLQGNRVH